jgi:hypothetical protein
MGDREGEDRRADGSAPRGPRGRVRSEYLFWTSPTIRSFTPVRPGGPPAPAPRDTADPPPEGPSTQHGSPRDDDAR